MLVYQKKSGFVKDESLLIKTDELKEFIDKKVEVIIIPLEEEKKEKENISFKTFKCGGAINKFGRKDFAGL